MINPVLPYFEEKKIIACVRINLRVILQIAVTSHLNMMQ